MEDQTSVGVGAIVVIDTETRDDVDRPSTFHPDGDTSQAFLAEPLAFAELFGRSILERTIERFAAISAQTSVLAHEDFLQSVLRLQNSFGHVSVEIGNDIWDQLSGILKQYSDHGIDYAFIARPSSYSEVNLADLLAFHREHYSPITRVGDAEGPLDLWIVNCADLSCPSAWSSAIGELSSLPGDYLMKGYVKRMVSPRDLRQLVLDAFLTRCQMRPSGSEVRPGVWVEQDAQIHRGARIIAPAYLGHGATIHEKALITRCSNIERFSCVDCGTAIEDSSVLPNTYIGISLDVRHSLVSANRLWSLERNVIVQISDTSLFRSNETEAVEGKEKKEQLAQWINRSPMQAPLKDKIQEQEYFTKAVPSVNTTEFES
jgi:carbonic anhydrase/acetyltransferase-like protein (isoleucine patch superfamily)